MEEEVENITRTRKQCPNCKEKEVYMIGGKDEVVEHYKSAAVAAFVYLKEGRVFDDCVRIIKERGEGDELELDKLEEEYCKGTIEFKCTGCGNNF